MIGGSLPRLATRLCGRGCEHAGLPVSRSRCSPLGLIVAFEKDHGRVILRFAWIYCSIHVAFQIRRLVDVGYPTDDTDYIFDRRRCLTWRLEVPGSKIQSTDSSETSGSRLSTAPVKMSLHEHRT